MRCRHCQSVMEQTEAQTSRNSTQVKYRCPACGHFRLVSLPLGQGTERETHPSADEPWPDPEPPESR